MNNVTIYNSLSGFCVTGGVINVYNALSFAINHTHNHNLYAYYDQNTHSVSCYCGNTYYENHQWRASTFAVGGVRICIKCGATKL